MAQPPEDYFSQFDEVQPPARVRESAPDAGYFSQFEEVREDTPGERELRYQLQGLGALGEAAAAPFDILASIAADQGKLGFTEARSRFPEQVHALTPEDEERLKYVQERVPTYHNLERYAEEKTGIPFQAKTGVQRGARTIQGLSLLAPLAAAPVESFISRHLGPRPPGPSAIAESITGGGRPPGGPVSPYELQKEAVESLAAQEAQALQPRPKTVAEQAIPGEQKGVQKLENRVTLGGKDAGIRPVTKPENPTPIESAQNIVSKYRVANPTEAGKTLEGLTRRADTAAKNTVTRLYDQSKELQDQVFTIRAPLVNTLLEQRAAAASAPSPSSVQKQIIQAYDDVLEELVVLDEFGAVSGYKPITNSRLIDQIKANNLKVDFDFPTGSANATGRAKNVYKPFNEALSESVESSALATGNLEAADALAMANRAHADRVEKFLTHDYINDLRNVNDLEHAKHWSAFVDTDRINALKPTLERTPGGKAMIESLQADLVDKKLGRFLKEPKSSDAREFQKTLAEIEPTIGRSKANEIQTVFDDAVKSPSALKFKAKDLTDKPAKAASEYIGKPPEYIRTKLQTRTGIRELRGRLQKTERGSEIFDELMNRRAQSILQRGEIHTDTTGTKIADVLNDEHNFDFFAEYIGEKETLRAKELATKLGDKEQSIEQLIQLGKKYGIIKFFTMWGGLL